MAKQRLAFQVDGAVIEEVGVAPIDIDMVYRSFPKLPVYTMGADNIVLVKSESSAEKG